MKEIKILLVEDEQEIAKLVQRYLEKESYEVFLAENGKVAYELFLNNSFDLVITDIMMPVMDGVELVKKLRNDSNVPIFFLTAKDDEVDKLLGLMFGADDYITKPFSMHELIARVQAILRRHLEFNQGILPYEIFKYEDLEVDFDEKTVKKSGILVEMRSKEFEILALLAKSPGKVFSKKQIYLEIWGSPLQDDNTLMVHMRRLRQKIEKDPNNPEYIQTVWGLGYKFVGE